MTKLALNFFGTTRFERDGAAIEFSRAKGIALLLYLAVARDAQSRERVVDLLWPESLPQAAQKNLRNTLWAIGEAFGQDALEHDHGKLRLAANVVVDAHVLEDGLLLLEGGSVPALEQVTALYQGSLAAGLVVHEAPDFELWLQVERERLATLYLHLLERLLVLQRAANAWESVIVYSQRALAVDPLREPIHLMLIEAYVRLGQRAQAARQYEALSNALEGELGIAPLPETTARYQSMLADVAQAPAALPAPPTNRVASTPPFIGRVAELAALDEERARAVSGGARVALISGDLGLGKTRLWQTWLATSAGNAVVLTTHTLETAEPVPFAPLLALFRRPGSARDIITPPSLLAPIWLAELVRLLPEIALTWPDLPRSVAMSAAEERGRLLQALTEAMRLLVRPLLVLVVDDLQWADPSTLDWLIYLVDQLQDQPLLLIGTVRPQDSAERLLSVAGGWQRQGRLRRLPLSNLTLREGGELLDTLGWKANFDQQADWLQQSGGNPLFLIELQRAPAGAAHDDLATLVRARLQATISAVALQVLQAAAVLGDEANFELLQTVSGRSEEETLDALDLLGAAPVLIAQGRFYRFTHPLVGAIVRADLSPARRGALHRRAAEALERAYAPRLAPIAGLLIEHFAAAGALDRAAGYAEQAAAQALEVGALVEAVAFARRALDWNPTARRRLLLGEALLPLGGAGEALAALEAAWREFEAIGDVQGAVEALLSLALHAVATSQPDVARSWLERSGIQQVATMNPQLYGQALLMTASVERQTQRYERAAALLEQAARLAQERKIITLGVQIAFEQGNLLAAHGALPLAVAAFAEALSLAKVSTNPAYAAMAWNNLAYHTLLSGDVAQAWEFIAAAAELTRRYSLNSLWQFIHSTTGEILLARGELDNAATAFTRSFAAAQAWDNHVHMANVRINQARVAQARHDAPLARALVEQAQELFGKAVDPFVGAKIEQIRAELI